MYVKKVKDSFGRGHEGPKREKRYKSALSLTSTFRLVAGV